MNITYLNSYENAIKSRLAFDNLSTRWKTMLVYRAAFVTILIFVLMYQFKLGFTINWVYYPVCNVPIGIFFGWLAYKFSIISRHNAILQQFEGLPADYFGSVSISTDDDGITVRSHYIQSKYDWRFINSIKTTKDYLFLTFDKRLILSIPTSALGAQQTEFVTQVERWIFRAESQLPNSINSDVS